MSENSYLRQFSAQVSQSAFLAYLTVLQPYDLIGQKTHTTYYNCMTWNVRKLISPPFQRKSISNCVFRFFHPLRACYNIMTLNFLKTLISTILVHKYHKSCS